jgi:dsDNA-specific endonuclease/ATPase MutS2
MSAIERGLYVTVGAADLAAEKVRDLPAVKFVVERTSKLRDTSLIEQAREIEPKVRKQAEELQARGEQVVARIRKDAKDFQQQVKDFPEKARKEIQEFPDTARKQATELRDNARKQATELRERFEKTIRRENGQAAQKERPAPKTSAAKATASSAKSSA